MASFLVMHRFLMNVRPFPTPRLVGTYAAKWCAANHHTLGALTSAISMIRPPDRAHQKGKIPGPGFARLIADWRLGQPGSL